MRAIFSKPLVWFLVVFLALSAFCLALFTRGRSQKTSPDRAVAVSPGEGIVALVNGQPITGEVWQRHTARRRPDGARAALDDLIRQELLYQRAREAGYDHDPLLLASFRRMVAAKFEEEHLAQRSSAPATVQEAQAHYDVNLDSYRVPEKRRAAVVFVRAPRTASAEKKSELARRADAIREEALASQPADRDFGALAAKYSDDQATRYAGGDLGWLAKTETAPRFGQALNQTLFALTNSGHVSPVFEVPDGFCFIKLLDQQPASVRRFEEVRDAVVYQLTQQRQQQARREFDQQLRAGAEIQINDEAVAAATVTAKNTEPKPPRMPSL
jgi:parvulin-like peptidyl-prolyl isomerase